MEHPTGLLVARLAGGVSGLVPKAIERYPPVTLVIERGWSLDCEDVGKLQTVGPWRSFKSQELGVFRGLLMEVPWT